MQVIPLEAIPNQELNLNLDGVRWTITIKVAVTSMIVDVLLNDAPLILGQRIAVGCPLIPYEYMTRNGNFILLVDNEELPDYTKFGLSQQLLYLAPGELAYA